MKKQDFTHLIDSLLPQIWSFCLTLEPRENKAEKVLVDAYTVFLMKEKELLEENLRKKLKSNEEKISLRKYFLKEMIRESYELALKQVKASEISRTNLNEFSLFYKVKMKGRAVLFLKEKLNFSIEDIQETFLWQRHEIVESYHNSKNELLGELNESCF